MKSLPWLASCAIAGSALTSAAWALPPAPSAPASELAASASPIGLKEALEAAWQRSLQAREVQGQHDRAQADRIAASSLWAATPALELSHRDDRWQSARGGRETELGLVWPLWWPGQRAASGAVADTELALAALAHDAQRWRLGGELREAAWALAALQAEQGQAQALLDSLRALSEDVERRVQAGDLARADALAANAEVLAASAQQLEVRQRLLAARSHWRLLTGLDALALLQTEAEAVDDAARLAAHPALRLAEQELERARQRVALVRASQRDAPELTLRYRQELPGRAEPTHNSVGIGLRLPFGGAQLQQPALTAALSELDLAHIGLQRLREQQAAEARAARAALHASAEQWSAERTRAALLRERAALIAKSFRAGETALPELLRSLGAAAQAEAAVVRQQAALGLARARLNHSLGLLP